jgi:hypothetical protein
MPLSRASLLFALTSICSCYVPSDDLDHLPGAPVNDVATGQTEQSLTGCELDCPTGVVYTCAQSCSVTNDTITCNGQVTVCPCVSGQTRYRSTSTCCCNYDNPDKPVARHMLLVDLCVGGQWQSQGGVCDGSNCGGICAL